MKILLVMIFVFISSVYSQTKEFKQELKLGVAYYKTHKYEQALIIFDRLLINNPNSKRVRLEYARTLYALKMYKESKKEFLYVLNKNPPDIVKKNIKYFIKKIDKKRKTNFFQGRISIGVTNDSNIANKTFIDTTQYGNFLLTNDINERKDRYTTISVSLTHIKKLENSRWISSLYLSNDFLHDKSEDKVSIHNFSTRYIVPLYGLRASFPLSLTNIYIDGEKYSQNLSVEPTISKRLTKTKSISLSYIYQKNKNNQDSDKNTISRGANTRFSWMINKFSNSLGISMIKYQREQGTRLDVGKKQQSFDFSTSHPLFETNFLSFFYRHQKDIYTHKDPVLQYHRTDKKDNLNLSFNQHITNRNSFKVSFSKSKNSSNINSYSYKKDIFSFKFTHKY